MVTPKKNRETQTSWFKIIICFGAGVLLVSHTGKIPGAIPLIQAEFNLSLTKIGFLVSGFSLVGLLFGLWFGHFFQRYPLWGVAASSLLISGLSSALITLTNNFTVLMLSRFAEGAGFMLGIVSLPMLIAANSNARDRPLALAIWSCFVPIGIGITLAFSAPILSLIGWRGVWLIISGFSIFGSIIITVIFSKSLRESSVTSNKEPEKSEPIRSVFKTKEVILFGTLFLLFSIQFQPTVAYLPSLLLANGDLNLAAATYITAFGITLNAAGNLFSVWVLRNTSLNVFELLTISVSINLVFCSAIFLTNLPLQIRLASSFIFLGSSGLLPGLIWIHLNKISRNQNISQIFSAFIIQCSFIGQFIGPIFIGFIVDLTDQWSSSIYATILAGGISLGVCTYYLTTMKNI
jgi:predicted MFS family arabinose efflux permease